MFKFLTFACLLTLCSVTFSYQTRHEFIKEQIAEALDPLSKLKSGQKFNSLSIFDEQDPHVIECIETFQAELIAEVAENIFDALGCIESRLDDFMVEINELSEKFNMTVEAALPKIEEHVNVILECVILEDYPGIFAEARLLVGDLLGMGFEILTDVGEFIDVALEIIKEEEAEECLLTAFVDGVTNVNEDLEELETCIDNPILFYRLLNSDFNMY